MNFLPFEFPLNTIYRYWIYKNIYITSYVPLLHLLDRYMRWDLHKNQHLQKSVFDTNEIVLRIYFSAKVLIFHVILHK